MVHDGWEFAFGVQCVCNVGNFPSVGDVLVTGCNRRVGGHFDGGRGDISQFVGDGMAFMWGVALDL